MTGGETIICLRAMISVQVDGPVASDGNDFCSCKGDLSLGGCHLTGMEDAKTRTGTLRSDPVNVKRAMVNNTIVQLIIRTIKTIDCYDHQGLLVLNNKPAFTSGQSYLSPV